MTNKHILNFLLDLCLLDNIEKAKEKIFLDKFSYLPTDLELICKPIIEYIYNLLIGTTCGEYTKKGKNMSSINCISLISTLI